MRQKKLQRIRPIVLHVLNKESLVRVRIDLRAETKAPYSICHFCGIVQGALIKGHCSGGIVPGIRRSANELYASRYRLMINSRNRRAPVRLPIAWPLIGLIVRENKRYLRFNIDNRLSG